MQEVNSTAKYETLYAESIQDPETFWSRQAKELYWYKRWTSPICK